MGRRRRVRGAAPEGEVDTHAGEAHGIVDAVGGGRVPGDGDIDVVEVAGAHHESLGGAALLRRAAVISHATLDPLRGQMVLDGGRREKRRGPEHVVAASVPVAAGYGFLRLGDASDLREPRERIVFAEDGDHRAAVTGLAHDRRRDAGEVLRDAEAFLFQHRPVLGHRAEFAVGDLRHLPDAVG